MHGHKKEHRHLWEAFLKGDNEALANLFEAFSDSLFDYGSRFSLDERLVEDCIQDLFIKLCSNRSSLSLVDSPQFYLFKSLKNTIINNLERNQRYVYVSLQDLPFYTEYKVSHEQEGESIPVDTYEKILSVLNTLNDRQKEAIYLRYQKGMSYDEISQLLNIKYQSTRNLIHRAIEKIRGEMDLKLFLFFFVNFF